MVTTTLLSVILSTWNIPVIENKSDRHGSGDTIAAIGLFGLIRAYEHGCKDKYEIAEYLDVTEEYLEDCIDCYRDKYGECKTVDNYTIYFIPNLMIFKKI